MKHGCGRKTECSRTHKHRPDTSFADAHLHREPEETLRPGPEQRPWEQGTAGLRSAGWTAAGRSGARHQPSRFTRATSFQLHIADATDTAYSTERTSSRNPRTAPGLLAVPDHSRAALRLEFRDLSTHPTLLPEAAPGPARDSEPSGAEPPEPKAPSSPLDVQITEPLTPLATSVLCFSLLRCIHPKPP